jgi:hypothetical protein
MQVQVVRYFNCPAAFLFVQQFDGVLVFVTIVDVAESLSSIM